MNREIVGGGGASIYPLQGDVESTAGNSTVTVVGIQSIPVAVSFPTGGEVLTYDGPSNTLLLEAPVPATALVLETNGVTNGNQDLLNLVQGTGITITDDGLGDITIDCTVSGITGSHLVVTGPAPTMVIAAAMGTGATGTLTGNDTRGNVFITAGSGGSGSNGVATVTFNTPFSSTPIVVISAASPSAGAFGAYALASTPNGFEIFSTAVAPINLDTYSWDYIVIG